MSRNNLHVSDIMAVYHTLLFVHSSLLAAKITLHSAGAETTAADLQLAREAAYMMADLVGRNMDGYRKQGSPRSSSRLDARTVYWYCGVRHHYNPC